MKELFARKLLVTAGFLVATALTCCAAGVETPAFEVGRRITTTSQEISSGGMSLKGNHVPEQGSLVEVSFSLLTLPRVWVRGYVTWKKSNKTFRNSF